LDFFELGVGTCYSFVYSLLLQDFKEEILKIAFSADTGGNLRD